MIEGRLPQGQRGSWLVTGRRTYYDLVAGRLSSDIRKFPGFTDGQAKVVWEISPRTKLTLHALLSRESTDATPNISSSDPNAFSRLAAGADGHRLRRRDIGERRRQERSASQHVTFRA